MLQRQYNLIELSLMMMLSSKLRLLSKGLEVMQRKCYALSSIKSNMSQHLFRKTIISKGIINKTYFAFSKFKDEYNNEEEQEHPAILKEFEQLVTRFQTSYGEGRYEEARECLEKSAQIMKQTNCQNSLQYVQIMLNLVVTNNHLNAADRNIKALLQAESILDQLPEANYTHKQIVYNNLCRQYEALKDQQKTIEFLVKLLAIYNKTNIQSMQVVAINDKIGSLYIDMSQEEMALPFYKEGLSKIEKIKGENCPQSLRLLDDISYIYYKLEKYQDALESRQRVQRIVQKSHGKETVEYIAQLKNVGAIYKKLKDFKNYSECYEQALDITALSHLKQHPTTNWIRENLAMSYYSLNEFSKAIPRLETSIKYMSFQKEREKYIFFRKAAAECYKNMHEHEIALTQYQMVIDMLGSRNEKSCEYAYILSEIGLMNYNLEKYQEALKKYLKSLEIEEAIHGKASETCIRLYENVAELYYLLGDTAKSQEYLREIEKHSKNATKTH